MMVKKKLTDKQKMFVKEYLVDLNATQACIRAGYSEDTARQVGSENLSKPYIQEAIQEAMSKRAEAVGIKAEDVLKGIKDLTALVSDPNKKQFNATAGLKGYELQGKHLKLFTDKVEHSGVVGLKQALNDADDAGGVIPAEDKD